MTDGIHVELAELRPALERALVHLRQTPHAHRPFVLVQDVVTGRFVQFAGSDVEGIVFDCPALHVTLPVETIAEAAKLGWATLRGHLRLPDVATLRIQISTSTRPSERD
jgi:hypothetical protein